MIPFNKPYLTGKETIYIKDAVKSGKILRNGLMFGFKNVIIVGCLPKLISLGSKLNNFFF
jgi:hypothetical protein